MPVNSEQAKTIPIVRILEILGHQPKRKTSKYYTYLSPLRPERTASFSVSLDKNYWHDFGTGIGGSIIDFAVEHLKSQNEACTVSDALRWIGNLAGTAPCIRPVPVECHPDAESTLVLKAAYKLTHPALIQYVQHRGISEKLALTYLKELKIYNRETRKPFFALGFRNEENGYEFRTNFLKGCLGAKRISFIRGTREVRDKIHIFEGFMDFLSALQFRGTKRLAQDTIVLNSLSLLKQATPYIQGYGYKIAYTWLDNDKSGDKATQNIGEFCVTEPDLRHRPMNNVYKNHKDVNAWHMHKLSVSE